MRIEHATRKCLIYSLKFLIYFSFDGERYVTVEKSKYPHDQTLGLGNYRGKAFTTGCYRNGCRRKVATEFLDMTTIKWSNEPDYPFAS